MNMTTAAGQYLQGLKLQQSEIPKVYRYASMVAATRWSNIIELPDAEKAVRDLRPSKQSDQLFGKNAKSE